MASGSMQESPARACHERLRQVLHGHDVTFQRTRTWKESNDPDRDAKLALIEEAVGRWPDRCFAFDGFGPLQMRPVAGSGWWRKSLPQRLLANYNKRHGTRQFHGCCSVGEDTLGARVRSQRGRRWGIPTTQAARNPTTFNTRANVC